MLCWLDRPGSAKSRRSQSKDNSAAIAWRRIYEGKFVLQVALMTGANRRRASRHSTADENIFTRSRPVIYRPTVPGANDSYCGARHAQPVRLFVSGCAAPQDRSRSRHLHALPDD
jgi:hypothetical protein